MTRSDKWALMCLDQNFQENKKTRKRSKLSIFCFWQKLLFNNLKNSCKKVYVVIFYGSDYSSVPYWRMIRYSSVRYRRINRYSSVPYRRLIRYLSVPFRLYSATKNRSHRFIFACLWYFIVWNGQVNAIHGDLWLLSRGMLSDHKDHNLWVEVGQSFLSS